MDYIKLLDQNGLLICPITSKDVQIAEEIFGPDVGALKGKTTCIRPPIVELPVSSMGTHILKEYQMVTLCIDVMYVNQNQC